MKFKLKLLAAAVALVAATGANATVDLGTGTATTNKGNGGLFLSVWDDGGTSVTSDDRAYVLNLGSLTNGSVVGGHINDWASAVAVPVLNANKQTTLGAIFSVAADANLQSFLAATSNLSGLKWNIAANDSNGNERALVTGVAGQTSSLTDANFVGGATTLGIVNYLTSGINTAMGANNSVLLSQAAANIGIWGNSVNGKLTPFNTAAGLGQNLDMYLFSANNADDVNTPVTLQSFANDQWKLASNGTLTYGAAVAAVPEPETYGMLAAGLLMLGAVARRRNRG